MSPFIRSPFMGPFIVLTIGLLALDVSPAQDPKVSIVVLGIAQDAGYPQAGCNQPCCQPAWADASRARMVSCVAVVDQTTDKRFVFDCTPDFPRQLRLLDRATGRTQLNKTTVDGIFLTHAHIGHYTGLMHLGREAMGSGNVPVYAMPRMDAFLRNHGPWSQLVKLKNISLVELAADKSIRISESLAVTPIMVPHRDEFSETVAFKIKGPNRTALYLPDIDKWSRWDRSIEELIKSVDIAFVDGTFLANGEIPGRDMSLIPHPFIEESIIRFSALDETERNKVRFIHLNHTNPALQSDGAARRQIAMAGMHVAEQGQRLGL